MTGKKQLIKKGDTSAQRILSSLYLVNILSSALSYGKHNKSNIFSIQDKKPHYAVIQTLNELNSALNNVQIACYINSMSHNARGKYRKRISIFSPD